MPTAAIEHVHPDEHPLDLDIGLAVDALRQPIRNALLSEGCHLDATNCRGRPLRGERAARH